MNLKSMFIGISVLAASAFSMLAVAAYIAIGNSAPGSVWYITVGLLADKTGIDVKHIPFNGAQPAVTALVGGHIKAVSVSSAEVRG